MRILGMEMMNFQNFRSSEVRCMYLYLLACASRKILAERVRPAGKGLCTLPRQPFGRGIAESSLTDWPQIRVASHARQGNSTLYFMLRLVKPVEARRLCCASIRRCGSSKSYLTAKEKQHDPLNILFCGADEFSIYSLRALRELQTKQPEKIARIDVVCRRDKYVGRGLKNIQEGEICEQYLDLQELTSCSAH
jgi:hypothetical protein